jgi:hypothetical protein
MTNMKQKFLDAGLRLAVASLLMIFGYTIPQVQAYTPRETQEGQPVLTAAGKPAYNIDQ